MSLLEVSPEIFCLSEPCGGRYREDDNIFRHHTASLQLWRTQINKNYVSGALHITYSKGIHIFKGRVPREVLLQDFSLISTAKPLIITLGLFRFFLKIREDIRNSRCTTGINDTGGAP